MKCSDTEYNGSPWEWRTLGVADPGGGGPWEWRTLTQKNTDQNSQETTTNTRPQVLVITVTKETSIPFATLKAVDNTTKTSKQATDIWAKISQEFTSKAGLDVDSQ